MSMRTCVFLTATIFVSVTSQQQVPNVPELLSHSIPVENIIDSTVVAQQDGEDFRPAPPPSPPINSGHIEILNRKSIHKDGYRHTKRRTTRQLAKDAVLMEEFLPLDLKPKKILAIELFDQAQPDIESRAGDSADENDSGSGSGNGDIEEASMRLLITKNGSSTHLVPGPGLLYNFHRSSHSGNVMADELNSGDESNQVDRLSHQVQGKVTDRPQVDPDAEWWDLQWSPLLPKLQQEVKLGGGDTEEFAIKVTDVELDTGRDFNQDFTTLKPITKDEKSATGPVGQPSTSSHHEQTSYQSNFNDIRVNSTVSNSTKWRYSGPIATLFLSHGRVSTFLREHAAIIVGIMMSIPMMLILLYFIHLRRRRGYTGTLNVSPTSVYMIKKKPSMFRSGVTLCSQENELSRAPSTSSTPPKPPPLPLK